MNNTATEQTNDRAATSTSLSNHSKIKPIRSGTTKKAQLVRLLQRKAGVDIATISKELGWQPHTTRAALSGLRKAGYGIPAEKLKADRPARYKITSRADGAGT